MLVGKEKLLSGYIGEERLLSINIDRKEAWNYNRTRLLYVLYEEGADPIYGFYVRFTAKGRVFVDWGDGETSTGNNDSTGQIYEHTYAEPLPLIKIDIYGANTLWAVINTGFDDSFLQKVYIGDMVTQLGANSYGVFEGYTGLKEIIFSASSTLTSIMDYAFLNCTSLDKITIPKSVTSIGSGNVFGNGSDILKGCINLTEIEIPFTGAKSRWNGYMPEKLFGYLFSTSSYEGATEVTQKYQYTNISYDNKVYYIPSTLRTVKITGSNTDLGNNTPCIVYGAFSGCSMLTQIIITGNVMSIGGSAFEECTSLENIIIPNSITSIGDRAFYNCESLTGITYNGTVEQWGSISRGNNWAYSVPSNCKIYCTNGDLDITNFRTT